MMFLEEEKRRMIMKANAEAEAHAHSETLRIRQLQISAAILDELMEIRESLKGKRQEK